MKSDKSIAEQIVCRAKRDGSAKAIEWLARGFAKMGKSHDSIPTLVRMEFERAGIPFRVPGRNPIQVTMDAVKETII